MYSAPAPLPPCATRMASGNTAAPSDAAYAGSASSHSSPSASHDNTGQSRMGSSVPDFQPARLQYTVVLSSSKAVYRRMKRRPGSTSPRPSPPAGEFTYTTLRRKPVSSSATVYTATRTSGTSESASTSAAGTGNDTTAESRSLGLDLVDGGFTKLDADSTSVKPVSAVARSSWKPHTVTFPLLRQYSANTMYPSSAASTSRMRPTREPNHWSPFNSGVVFGTPSPSSVYALV